MSRFIEKSGDQWRLHAEQRVLRPIELVVPFIADAANLQRLAPCLKARPRARGDHAPRAAHPSRRSFSAQTARPTGQGHPSWNTPW